MPSSLSMRFVWWCIPTTNTYIQSRGQRARRAKSASSSNGYWRIGIRRQERAHAIHYVFHSRCRHAKTRTRIAVLFHHRPSGRGTNATRFLWPLLFGTSWKRENSLKFIAPFWWNWAGSWMPMTPGRLSRRKYFNNVPASKPYRADFWGKLFRQFKFL